MQVKANARVRGKGLPCNCILDVEEYLKHTSDAWHGISLQ